MPYTGGKFDEEMGTHLLFQDRVGHWGRRRGAHIGVGRCSTWHTPTRERGVDGEYCYARANSDGLLPLASPRGS